MSLGQYLLDQSQREVTVRLLFNLSDIQEEIPPVPRST